MVVAVIAGVYIRRTEKIGIKDAGHTFFAQQNDRIGQRLEPGFNGRFQRLQRLRVVVVDKRDGVIWNSGKQRAIKDSAHVEIAALLGSVMEAVVKGDIEEHQLLVDQIEIAFQRVYIGVPVFRHNEEVGINRVAHMAYPVAEEPCRNMFGGIQAETIHLHLFGKPPAPIFQFLIDSPVSEFDICAHEIIEVAVFLVDLFIPFAVAIFVDETENAVLIRLLDVVDAAEALEVPDEFGMRAVSAGKGEARIGVRLEILVLYLGAVIGIDAANPHLLPFIRAHLVIENHVVNDADAVFLQRPTSLFEGSAITVFGRDCSLLVEFAKVEEIIGIVTYRKTAGRTLVGRR